MEMEASKYKNTWISKTVDFLCLFDIVETGVCMYICSSVWFAEIDRKWV